MENDYLTIENVFDILNEKLFENKLPKCIFTLQRKKNCLGYFHPEKFKHKINNDIKDEIALNPDCFHEKDIQIFSTICHEMVHSLQFHFGNNKSKHGYHNKEWVKMMELVGLIPSNTGEPGGKKTGQKMSHYIDEKGKFKKIIDEIIENNKIKWVSQLDIKIKKSNKDKYKFVCPNCNQIAWAKENSLLTCGVCDNEMIIQ